MPFVRIAIPAGETVSFKQNVGQAIHDAMFKTINIPEDDKFQVLSEHGAGELMYDNNYLGVDRSEKCIFVQITMKHGRTPNQKKALYVAIAENLHTSVAWRKQDVMIILNENDLIDWSFGNGEAQIAGG